MIFVFADVRTKLSTWFATLRSNTASTLLADECSWSICFSPLLSFHAQISDITTFRTTVDVLLEGCYEHLPAESAAPLIRNFVFG